MRHRLAVQTTSRAIDAQTGEPVHTWSTDTTIWAEVTPISGRELLRADQTIGEVTHRVRCRHRASITERARFLFGSRVLEIVGVMDEDERGVWIECICREVV